MNDSHDFNRTEFDMLLSWLGQDRETAGEKYEQIRRSLIKILTCRGCLEAEDLADKTINRVVKKLPSIIESYKGDPARYFYGVADKVYLEYQRAKHKVTPLSEETPTLIAPEPHDELELNCLDECMEQMGQADRELVLLYYQEEKARRIAERKAMAGRLGIKLNTLRVKVFRLLTPLQRCMENCVENTDRLQ